MQLTKLIDVKQSVDKKLEVTAKTTAEINIFSYQNPLPPRIAADYQQRAASARVHSFPHTWTPSAAEGYAIRAMRNIFDQSFVIASTYDAAVSVALRVIELAGGQSEIGNETIYELPLGTIPASDGTIPTTFIITPEAAGDGFTINKGIVVAVPELRQPFPAFSIVIAPTTAPTIGEIKILNTRRY